MHLWAACAEGSRTWSRPPGAVPTRKTIKPIRFCCSWHSPASCIPRPKPRRLVDPWLCKRYLSSFAWIKALGKMAFWLLITVCLKPGRAGCAWV